MVTDQPLPPQEAMDKLLQSMPQLGASDLHLKVGCPPCFRIAGQLRRVEMPPIPDGEYIKAMVLPLIPESLRDQYGTKSDLDFATAGAGGARFRVNLFQSTGRMHVAIRRIQSEIPSFEELSLPDIYRTTIAQCTEGLILVSGITGAGKSSTLAAMIEHVNQTRSVHIVTIEDPIEFMFAPKKAIIAQREIGIDVADYAEALRSVVRQDPDCILIGEMRDRDTMMAALQASETGHLVLGSLHCSDAQQTFTRILEFFPREDHAFIRSSLASSLKAIMCQRLIPGIDPDTSFPATEVLLNNTVVKDKIVREEDGALPGIIAKSEADGMRTFTESLCELIEAEKVHYDTAMDHAPNREALSAAVKGIRSV